MYWVVYNTGKIWVFEEKNSFCWVEYKYFPIYLYVKIKKCSKSTQIRNLFHKILKPMVKRWAQWDQFYLFFLLQKTKTNFALLSQFSCDLHQPLSVTSHRQWIENYLLSCKLMFYQTKDAWFHRHLVEICLRYIPVRHQIVGPLSPPNVIRNE